MVRVLALVACLAACAGGDAPGPDKPSVPIDVTLEARPLGAGDWELRLAARARADLEGAVLEIAGVARRPVGAVAAGAQVELVARTHAVAPVVLVGGARVRGGSRTTTVALGAARSRPAARGRVLETPFGPVTEAPP